MYRILKNAGKSEKHTFINLSFSGFAPFAVLRENQIQLRIMPVINIEVEISAPIERAFDLARSINLHEATMLNTNEKAIGGVTKGLISLDETVTWQATHFGIRQKL